MARPLRVFIPSVPGRSHNLYKELIEFPPDGIEYEQMPAEDAALRADAPLKPTGGRRGHSTKFLKAVYGPFLRGPMGGVGMKARVDWLRGHRGHHDVYHAVGNVHPLPEPWVLQFESSLDFFSFGHGSWRAEQAKASSRRYVERKLLSQWCRHIIPETDAARRSMLSTFPDHAADLDAKTSVVQIALRAGPEPTPEPSGPVKLLFVGSRNFPKDFLPKGGHLVLAAYAELRKARPDVELTVRSAIPEPWRSRYAATPGLTILDGELPEEQVRSLYSDHHVFVFPGSSTPGMVIREAMRAARPTVTIDVWANRELVENGVTGFVVEPPLGVEYTNPWGGLNWSHEAAFLDPFTTNIEPAIAQMTEKLSLLVDDAPLRRRMGAAARKEIATGKFSIGVRNAKLKRVYEDAAGRR